MFLRAFIALALAITLLPGVSHADDTPLHMTSGETSHVSLDKGESQDWTISLPKGDYYIVLDSKRSDAHSGNIQATVRLLKNNGVVVDDSLLTTNDVAYQTRDGIKFHVDKNLPGRLRLSHDQDIPIEFWMTVIPVASMKFIPFGYGTELHPLTIGTDSGVGGDHFGETQDAAYSVTLPPGKWSISLGLTLPSGESSNLESAIDLLDSYGLPAELAFVNMNEIDNQSRKEGILTLLKPKRVILRVVNTSGDKVYHYDVTVEKATD